MTSLTTRPISLTRVASKIMERIVSSQILDHLLANNLLHPEQHGFLRGRSTYTSFLESQNDWTFSIQYKNCVTVVYTVCHKKTCHSILVHNVEKCWPILKMLSLLDSAVNLQQGSCHISHRTLNVSLHYLVEYKKNQQ